MKAKITKRSKTDKFLVTIPLAQLDGDPELYVYRDELSVGEEVVAVIDGVATVCTLARPDKNGIPTVMTTRAYPRHLRQPEVGHPRYQEISEIR